MLVQVDAQSHGQAMTKKERQIKPASTLQSQAVARFNLNESKANPRDFRDALTKVTGGVRGIPTNAMQWNRWDK
jgi:hypothetical protein